MKHSKHIIIFLLAIILISGLSYKVYNQNLEINKLSKELEETITYYIETIENMEDKHREELWDQQHGYENIIYGDKYEDKLISDILGFDINNISEANKSKWFYYNKLDDDMKEVYETVLYSLVKQQECEVYLTDIKDDNDVWSFLEYIAYDHERLFWINYYEKGTIKYKKGKNLYTFKGQAYNELDSVDEIYKAWKQIRTYKEKALRNTDSLSKQEIEKHIHDYIIENTDYDSDNSLNKINQSIYSTVRGKTVCTGYGKLFKYICSEAGIECLCVKGKENVNNKTHLWNIVLMDENVYMVDCTADENTGNKMISYESYNKSLEYMNENYTIDENFNFFN